MGFIKKSKELILGKKNSGEDQRAPFPKLRHLSKELAHFNPVDPPFAGNVAIYDLSCTGINFVKGHTKWPPMGTTITGDLILRGHPHRAHFELVAKHLNTVEARVSECDKREYQGYVAEEFHSRFSGLNLHQVKPKILAGDWDGHPWWYLGPEGDELFGVTKKGKLTHFHISLDNSYIEYNTDTNVRFANLSTDEDGNKIKSSTLLHFQNEVPTSILDEFQEFAQSIPHLSKKRIKMVMEILNEAQT